ncbi:MAG: Ig-like domain-containing protein [Gemmatimonadota bacterium]|nr:Ig-like domain-containing protein [Burkholderiales bacterium]MDE3174344.1 Ig-like domain-containing protein [Gemmatimonadota bacterium]
MNTKRLLRWTGALAMMAGVSLVGSCNGDSVSPDRTVSIARVAFPSPTDTVLVGDSLSLSLTVEDANGIPLTRSATWTSSDPLVATVSETGLVVGHDGGAVTIRATVGGISATKQIFVLERVAAVALQHGQTPDTLLMTDTLWLTVQLQDPHGKQLQRQVTWRSSDSAVATVGVTESAPPVVSRGPSLSTAGASPAASVVGGGRAFVLAMGPGAAVITATAEGMVDSTTVTVGEPVAAVELSVTASTIGLGTGLQIQARLHDRHQQQLHRRIAWTSSNPDVATVNGNGMVMAHGLGTCTVTATSENVSASATVNVVPAAGQLSVSPANISLRPRDTLRISATVLDAAGAPLGRRPAWASADTMVATVDSLGLITAVGAGTTTVTAQIDALSAPVGVAVVAPTPFMKVEPANALVVIGATVTYTATIYDTAGKALPAEPMVWSTDDPSIATIDGTGLATAKVPGRVTIVATGGGLRGTAFLTVAEPAVATITIEPATDSVLIGDVIDLVATARDAQGRALGGVPFGWSSDHSEIVAVNESGQATAIAEGVASIQAGFRSHSGTATITVFRHPSSVTVNPPQAQVRMGDHISMSAVLHDAGGNPQGGKVTWTTTDAAIATVSTSGVVTGVAEGSATIVASSGGKSDSARVVVTGAPPSTDEGLGNNLSVPVVFADGLGLTGLPVTVEGAPHYLNTGLRPAAAENLLVDALPYFYAGNVSDCAWPDGTRAYCQKGVNGWQAQWQDGSSAMQHATATWGDNILSQPLRTSSPVRVEVSLNDVTSGLLTGFNMQVVSGSGSTEQQGTDGHTSAMTPTIYTVVPHLVVSKIDTAGGHTTGDPVVDKSVIGSIGAEEGPGTFGAEVNVGGKIIYGYGLRVTEAGWYRVSFILEGSATNGTVTANRNVTIDAVTNTGSEESEGSGGGESGGAPTGDRPLPQVSSDGSTTWIDIYVGPAQGSGEGGGGTGGGDTGAGNNLSVPVTFAEGIGLGGLPVTVDGAPSYGNTGLRPVATGEPAVDALPFFPTSYNVSNCELTGMPYFCQGGGAVWQAQWLDASALPRRDAEVAWSDNLLTNHFNTHANVHIEVSLADLTTPAMQGFNMAVVSGEGSTELQGTNGTTAAFTPSVYTRGARLKIELLDSATHVPEYTVFDGGVWEAGDGPGQFATEVSMAGRVVYSYNLLVQSLVVPADVGHKYGWYRFTFSIDGSGPVTPNVRMTQMAGGGEEGTTEEGGGSGGSGSGGSGSGGIPSKNVPTFNAGAQSTSVEVWIAKGGGGGGGH